jgi:hypothetical protein
MLGKILLATTMIVGASGVAAAESELKPCTTFRCVNGQLATLKADYTKQIANLKADYEKKLIALENKLMPLIQQAQQTASDTHQSLDNQIAQIEATKDKLGKISGRLDGIDDKLAKLDGKLGSVEGKVNGPFWLAQGDAANPSCFSFDVGKAAAVGNEGVAGTVSIPGMSKNCDNNTPQFKLLPPKVH